MGSAVPVRLQHKPNTHWLGNIHSTAETSWQYMPAKELDEILTVLFTILITASRSVATSSNKELTRLICKRLERKLSTWTGALPGSETELAGVIASVSPLEQAAA